MMFYADAVDNQQELIAVKYEVLTIDVRKLAQTPEAAIILRLMWGLNEMNQLADLARMVDAAESRFPHRWKYYEGLKESLIRQRSSVVGEALDTIVRPLVAQDAAKKYPALNNLISKNPELRRLRGRLQTLFYGKWKKKFELHRQIRHRVTAHFDHKSAVEILPTALKTLVKSRRKERNLEGWTIRGAESRNVHIQRFLLVDEVLTTAWRENILGIKYRAVGYSKSRKVDQTKKFTRYIGSLFHAFADTLVFDYLEHFELFIDGKGDDLLKVPHA